MIKLILIFAFLLMPFLLLTAQDKSDNNLRPIKSVKVIYKEVTCGDCQGWGWILGETLKTNYTNLNSNSGGEGSSRRKPNTNTFVEQQRHICPECFGKGKVFIKTYE